MKNHNLNHFLKNQGCIPMLSSIPTVVRMCQLILDIINFAFDFECSAVHATVSCKEGKQVLLCMLHTSKNDFTLPAVIVFSGMQGSGKNYVCVSLNLLHHFHIDNKYSYA